MGGEIDVQSEPDRGALFWFTARFAAGDAPLAAQRRTLEGIGGLILSGDEVFAQIVERYMTSWSMESRRALSREHVVTALQTNDSPQWVAIVDLDNIGVADLGVTLDIVRAILPARVVAVGNDAQLRKPLRQSQLFDAIVRAVDIAPPPVHPVPPVAETKEAEPAAYGKVLVAEDNQRLQRLLKLQFDDLGVAATFVPDGRAVLEALRRETYALVFMDCQMPHMDGLTATRAIREAERQTGAHVPIAAMTANAFAEDREACIAAGMDDYLSKPVRLADLRAMIERWATRVRSS
jgi:CheY-like chemotaxis protein